jgi:hypothetical protein
MNTTQSTFAGKKKTNRTTPHRTPTLLSLLVLLVLALFFWWIHVQHTAAEGQKIAGSNADMYAYHLPVRDFAFSHLKDGKIPLYNPYTDCGMPFLATYQAALFYPLNFFHWFLPPASALSLIYLLHIFLAGVFMFFWMRELQVSEVAAAFAGTAYMLCSFVTYILAWPHIVLTHVWIPLVFLLVHRAFYRGRLVDMILLGAGVGSQFLAGYMQGFVYTLYGAFAYLFFLTITKLAQRKPDPISTGRSFFAVLLGLTLVPALLTAVQWMPTLQLSELSARPTAGLSQSAILFGGSLYPSTFLAALINPASYTWSQYTLYPGIAALLLAAFAFTQRERWREILFFSTLAVAAALIAFGTHTPLFRLYLLLPTGDWFRLPNRLLILTAFSLATLAGLGAHHLIHDVLERTDRPAGGSVRLGVFVGISALFILLLPKSASVFVFILLIGSLLAVRARSAVLAGMLAIVLLAFDLTLHVANPVTYPWITARVFPEFPEAKQFLQEKIGMDRVHVFRAKHDWKNYLLNANFGMTERIRETSGYESLALQRYAEFSAFMDSGGAPSEDLPFTGSVRWSAKSLHPQMLNLLGAKYIIEDAGRDLYPESEPPNKMPAQSNFKKVFSKELNIYENPDALPRAFFTTDFEVIPDKQQVLQRLVDKSLKYKDTVVLEEQPPQLLPQDSNEKQTEVILESPNESTTNIVVDAPADGLIFLDEPYLPGWRVRVDGNDVKPYRADYLFMAVPVTIGKHVVDFQYLPPAYRIGRWISLLSLVLLSLLVAFDLARRRARKMTPWEAKAAVPTLMGRKQAVTSGAGRVKKPLRD